MSADVVMAPLPGPSSMPVDEVLHAISLLTVAARALTSPPDSPSAGDLLVVLEDSIERLRPVVDFLDDIAVFSEQLPIFQKHRIAALS